jgi:hypothetical protein
MSDYASENLPLKVENRMAPREKQTIEIKKTHGTPYLYSIKQSDPTAQTFLGQHV